MDPKLKEDDIVLCCPKINWHVVMAFCGLTFLTILTSSSYLINIISYILILYIQGVSKKSRQILNRSLFREALQCTNIFIKVDCFGTYNVE